MRRDELLLTKGSRQAAMQQQHHQHKDWSTRVPTKHKHKSAHKGSAASNCRLRRLVLSGPQLCDPGHVALFANAQVYNFESLFAQPWLWKYNYRLQQQGREGKTGERVARAKWTDVSAGASGCLHLVLPLIKARTEVFACNQYLQLLNFVKYLRRYS